MKKVLAILTAVVLLCSLFAIPVSAAGSTALSLKPSSGTIRTGDTITVTGNFNGSATIGTFDLKITYNASQLQYVSAAGIAPAINAGELDVVPNGGNIQLLYLDADGGRTGVKNADAFKLTFKVIGGNVGDAISVDAQISTVGDDNATSVSANKSPANMTIAAPLSGNTFLSALKIDNGTLTPAFDKNTISYNVSIPFSVAKLNVTCTAEDPNSKVAVNSPALTPGATTNITVTVTAQTGAKKTYTIKVARAQDPNYKASGNNNLSGITVNLGILSPAFSKDITNYVVWLPYEVDKITAAGTSEDSKGTVTVNGGSGLVAGKDNNITVICTAENGNKKTYTIIAKRAAGGTSSTSSALDLTQTKLQISVAGKDGVNSAVNLDLSNSSTKQLDNSFFNTLSDNKNAKVNINLGGARITFEGKDVAKLSDNKTYDLTYTKDSQYKDTMIKAAGNENSAFTYSFAYHGNLPGYATFDINTNFVSGEKVNVYKYDPDKQQYILIADSVTVSAGGVVTYINNTCSDYLITTKAIANAVKSDAVAKQVSTTPGSNSSTLFIIIIGALMLVVGAGVGFGVKTIILKKN